MRGLRKAVGELFLATLIFIVLLSVGKPQVHISENILQQSKVTRHESITTTEYKQASINSVTIRNMPKPLRLSQSDYQKLYTLKSDERKTNNNIIELNIVDATILMKIAVLEDHTDEISQAYIMSLILNRVNSPDFPNTVREVIEQKGQFLKLSDSRYINAEPDVNSHLALALIESGQIQTDYLYYEAIWVKESWASRHRTESYEYGGSRFYK